MARAATAARWRGGWWWAAAAVAARLLNQGRRWAAGGRRPAAADDRPTDAEAVGLGRGGNDGGGSGAALSSPEQPSGGGGKSRGTGRPGKAHRLHERRKKRDVKRGDPPGGTSRTPRPCQHTPAFPVTPPPVPVTAKHPPSAPPPEPLIRGFANSTCVCPLFVMVPPRLRRPTSAAAAGATLLLAVLAAAVLLAPPPVAYVFPTPRHTAVGALGVEAATQKGRRPSG